MRKKKKVKKFKKIISFHDDIIMWWIVFAILKQIKILEINDNI